MSGVADRTFAPASGETAPRLAFVEYPYATKPTAPTATTATAPTATFAPAEFSHPPISPKCTSVGAGTGNRAAPRFVSSTRVHRAALERRDRRSVRAHGGPARAGGRRRLSGARLPARGEVAARDRRVGRAALIGGAAHHAARRRRDDRRQGGGAARKRRDRRARQADQAQPSRRH